MEKRSTDGEWQKRIEPIDIVLRSAPKAPGGRREPKLAICLSGGGYRAMLYHVGALRRLNEFGFLGVVDRFSSVSGGSITAAVLALNWTALKFDQNGVAQRFDVVERTCLTWRARRSIGKVACSG